MKSLLAAVLGGILVFVWNAVSWMVLNWHDPTIKSFTTPDQVTQVLVQSAPTSGIYVLNYPAQTHAQDASGQPLQEQADASAALADNAEGTPFAFVAFAREGFSRTQMTRQYAYSLAVNIVAALLIVLLVRAADELNYVQRFLFIATVGIVIALAGRVPYWIWWQFPLDYMLVDCADVVIGWAIAALVMAALTGVEHGMLGASYRRMRM
ncbi:MAG: hypothetical protein U1F34_06305 [Gammaproteobacteria bacterium]